MEQRFFESITPEQAELTRKLMDELTSTDQRTFAERLRDRITEQERKKALQP